MFLRMTGRRERRDAGKIAECEAKPARTCTGMAK